MTPHVHFSIALILLLSLAGAGLAFPPAPGFTVFGLVRDPLGWVIDSPGAKIVFRDAVTGAQIASSTVGGGRLDENYRVMVPLDQNRSGTAYRPGAIAEATPFAIEIRIDGVTYLPVQTVASPVEGAEAAEFLRLDLGLGLDADADGLPDLWEQWQLEGAGLHPGDLHRIDRDGDVDGDGLSNYLEYIAGTFAYLASDRLSLVIKSRGSDGWNALEFLAVVDKTYLIEESTDLKNWTTTAFTLTDDRAALVTDWQAPDTILQTVQASSTSPAVVYRLTVR